MMFSAGCEETDMQMATEAGLDAVKAITLSDETIQELSIQSTEYADSSHSIAPAGDKYAKRTSASCWRASSGRRATVQL